MEASLVQRVLESLLATGPVAVVLGVACYILWKNNAALQERLTKQQENYEQQREHQQQRSDRQQEKMLRLAIRVQQAVEALAGLDGPTVLDEDENEDDLPSVPVKKK